MQDRQLQAAASRSDETVRPGPNAVRNTVLVSVAGMMVGGAAVVWLTKVYIPSVAEHIHVSPVEGMEQLRRLALWLVSTAGLVTICAGIQGIVSFRRVVASGQYPYPGMRVLHETRVVRGWRSRVYGARFLVVAVVGLVIAPALLGLLYAKIDQLATRAAQTDQTGAPRAGGPGQGAAPPN